MLQIMTLKNESKAQDEYLMLCTEDDVDTLFTTSMTPTRLLISKLLAMPRFDDYTIEQIQEFRLVRCENVTLIPKV